MWNHFFHEQEEQEREEETKSHEEFASNMFQNTKVVVLSMDSIKSFYRKKEMWFILYYVNNLECREFIELWKTFAVKVEGIFKAAAVNCAKDEELCEEFGVQGAPSISIFNEKGKEEKIEGALNEKNLFNLGASRMKHFMKKVNKKTYKKFKKGNLIKVLFFTLKSDTSLLFKGLSYFYKNRLVFGEVNQSKTKFIDKFEVINSSFGSENKITTFPSILVLTNPEDYKGIMYQGDLNRDKIEAFLNEYASKNQTNQDSSHRENEEFNPQEDTHEPYNPEIQTSFNRTLIGVKQLTQEYYNKFKHCSSADEKLCFIKISSLEDGLEEYDINLLEELAEKYKKHPINFFYVNAQKYPNFFQSFVEDDQNADVIVIKGKNKKYLAISHYMGEDNFQTIKSQVIKALNKIVKGKGKFNKLNPELDLSTDIEGNEHIETIQEHDETTFHRTNSQDNRKTEL